MNKRWRLKSKDGKVLNFYPEFRVNAQGDVECTEVRIKEGENGYVLNYLDLHMFVYFIGNEEQRLKLANFQTKQIREIPYDVEFKITKQEKLDGFAKRRITLQIDELAMVVAKQEAQKINFKKSLMR